MPNRILFLLLISLPWLTFASQMQSFYQPTNGEGSLYPQTTYRIKKYIPISSEETLARINNNDIQVPAPGSLQPLSGRNRRSVTYNLTTGFTGKNSVGNKILKIDQPSQSVQTKKTITYTTTPTIETKQIISSKPVKIVTRQIKQSQPEQFPMPGSYFPIDDINKNQPALAALDFVRSKLPALTNSRLIRASYQVVAGFNYQFVFEYEYSKGLRLIYRVLLYRDLSNKYNIEQSQYTDLPKPVAGSFIHMTNKNDSPYIEKINQVLVSKLKGTISADSDLIDFDVSPPYYIFQYKVSHNSFIKVQLIYDPIINDVKVLSTSRQNIQAIQTKSVLGQPKLTQRMESRSTTPTTTTTRKTQLEEKPASKQTSTTTEKVNVPIFIKKQIFQKYQIPQTGINFSNIVQYKQSEDNGFDNVDAATSEIKQLVLTILQAVLPQIQSLDQQFQILAIKYRIQETKLSIFLLTNIRGQKSMQTITIKLPKKDIYTRITAGNTKQVTINRSNNAQSKQTRPLMTSIQTKTKIQNEGGLDLTSNQIPKLLKNTQSAIKDLKVFIDSKQAKVEVKSTKSSRDRDTRTNKITPSEPKTIINNFNSTNLVIKPNKTQTILPKKQQINKVQDEKIIQIPNSKTQIITTPQIRQTYTTTNVKTTPKPVETNPSITSSITSVSSTYTPALPIKSTITTITSPSSVTVPEYKNTSFTSIITKQNPSPSTSTITKTITTSTSSSSSSLSSTPKQPISKKTEQVIIHQVPTKSKIPKYTVSTNNNFIKSASGVSDPAFISLLTSSYIDSNDANVFDKIVNYLIDKIKIEGDFSIILVNQMKYGLRIVIQMNDSYKLYQAILTSDHKSPQLLLWRRISTITDISPEAFSQYYRIDSDQDLKTLIKQVFKSEQMISKFQRIISAEKKVSYDGVYYRFIVQSTTNHQFLITFYYIPDKNYHEILQYQLINNGYDARRQKRLAQIPQSDANFNIAKDYLSKRYSSVLRDTTISFISSYETQQSKYFRIVFSGDNGRYEAILAVNLQNGQVTNVRWEKLDDGYSPIPIQRLSNNNQYQSIRTSVKEHLKNKFGFQASPSYFEIKNVPASNSYYKLLFNNPFPFTMYVQDRDPDHSLYVRGMQRIQVAPASQYYNDRLFAGYSLINLSELQYDEIYQTFLSILFSKTQVTSANHEILAAFDLKTPSGIFYKVIYRVKGVLYLAHFSFTFSTKDYKLVSFQPFESNIQSGDYRWKCDSINSIGKICQKCQNDYILSLGRCYKRVLACNLQFAATCQVCNPGYVKSYGICESSPQKALPKPKQSVINAQQTIVTAQGCKTIYYEPNDNCLVYRNSLCEKCSYRFVLRQGVCKRVQDQCQVYDSAGICLKCYGNYYLTYGYCVALDPLCAAANNEGYCTKCYKNYVNIEGKCYIKSNIQISQTLAPPLDPLCIEWNGSKCERCQFGCFFSKKTLKCTIKDPYCQEFDTSAEQCIICLRGYSLNAGRKCQRAY